MYPGPDVDPPFPSPFCKLVAIRAAHAVRKRDADSALAPFLRFCFVLDTRAAAQLLDKKKKNTSGFVDPLVSSDAAAAARSLASKRASGLLEVSQLSSCS